MRPVMTKAAVLAGCALPWLSACGGATTPAHPTGTAATAQATASASPAPTDPAPAG